MNHLVGLLDRTAIGVSVICTVHCLALPALLVMAPTAVEAALGESFHQGLALFALPVSVIGLGAGSMTHGRWSIAALGAAGLLLLVGSAWLSHEVLGETGEHWATIIGATLVAASHLRNRSCCRATPGRSTDVR